MKIEDIALNNKYTKWYIDICKRAQNRNIPKTKETNDHHIVPKCFEKNNNKENISRLTLREHYITHWLLTKMFVPASKQKHQMICAFWNMCNGRTNNQQYKTARSFAVARKKYIENKKGRKLTEKQKQLISKRTKEGMALIPPKIRKEQLKKHLEKMRSPEKIEKQRKAIIGRKLSPEHKAKQKIILANCGGQNKGEKSPWFGLKWITNGNESKRISKNDKPPKGWRFGRTLNDN